MRKAICLLSIMCFFFSSCVEQTIRVKSVVIYENSEDGQELTLENDYLLFRFLPENTEFVLTEKATGVQWRSNPEGVQWQVNPQNENLRVSSDPLSDPITTHLMLSQFALEYQDVSGVGQTLFSEENSIARNAFQYALVDGGIEVHYTVGNLPRGFLFPEALPEDRMKSYLDQMEFEDRRRVEASFRLYDINNLRSNDNRSDLLNRYPDLHQGKVYILRDTTQEFMKESIEGFFIGAGYTRDDLYEDSSRYTAAEGADRPAFNITLRYTLDGNSLVVNVPFDRIAYRPAFPMIRLTLLPYFGAGSLEDEGYLLIPDGSGALMYFNNGRQNQTGFNNVMYGWDEAMPRNAIVSDNRAAFPAFGIQRNGNALLGVIEEGSSYANIRADVSRRNSSWNSVHARFDMVHGAVMDISGRTDRAVYLYETGLPASESITIRYTPCATDGYVGMAKEYRSRLLQRYPHLSSRKMESVPVAVEIAGAVNKTQHRMGIPFDLPLRLTSYKDAQRMVGDFADFGWKDVQVKLTGWFNHSVEHSVPTRVKLIKELGSKKHFKELVRETEKNDYTFYPEVDFLYMRDTKPFDGFSLYRDAARYVNRQRAERYPYSFVWFGERTQWGKLSYLVRPAYWEKLVDNFVKISPRLGLKNIAFRETGSKLSGDYNERRAISREAAMNLQQSKLSALSQSGTDVLVTTGNTYAAVEASFITDMALTDQGFGITDVSVPFYPMVLHGLVPFTGRAINLAEDYTINLLKTIESGAGLYFSFMKAESAVLQETKFRQYYANEYDKWVQDAHTLYRQFAQDFGALFSQSITNHVIVSEGLTLTEYEDGSRVLVNTGSSAAYYNGIAIDAKTYKVLRQGE